MHSGCSKLPLALVKVMKQVPSVHVKASKEERMKETEETEASSSNQRLTGFIKK